MFKNILILNTGGTFNKTYNQKNGNLEVPTHSNTINTILTDIYKTNKIPKIETIISKDSLDITKKDRELLLEKIKLVKEEKIIIIHGTDTMNKTAKFLNKRVKNKTIILTGSMQPFSISQIEPTGNLLMALGFIQNINKNGVYISMNGLVDKFTKIKKDYKKAVFKKRSKIDE
jgi:L-asparaginase